MRPGFWQVKVWALGFPLFATGFTSDVLGKPGRRSYRYATVDYPFPLSYSFLDSVCTKRLSGSGPVRRYRIFEISPNGHLQWNNMIHLLNVLQRESHRQMANEFTRLLTKVGNRECVKLGNEGNFEMKLMDKKWKININKYMEYSVWATNTEWNRNEVKTIKQI